MDDRQFEVLVADFGRRYGPLITAREAAEIAKRKQQTIYDWSCRGLLDGCKAKRGGALRLVLRDFVRLLLDHQEGPRP